MTAWHVRRRLERSVGVCDRGTCRDDPIPPGIYWIAIPWEDSLQTGVPKPQHWQLWLDSMVSLGWVKLISTVHHEGSGFFESIPGVPKSDTGIIGERGIDEPPLDWHLFEVLHDSPRWTPATGLGLPTVAPKGIETTEDDTIQSPELEDVSVWDKILPSSTSGRIVVTAVGLGGLALVIYGMTRR